MENFVFLCSVIYYLRYHLRYILNDDLEKKVRHKVLNISDGQRMIVYADISFHLECGCLVCGKCDIKYPSGKKFLIEGQTRKK